MCCRGVVVSAMVCPNIFLIWHSFYSLERFPLCSLFPSPLQQRVAVSVHILGLLLQSGDTILEMYSFPEDDAGMWQELLFLGVFFVALSSIRYLLLRFVQHINR